MTTLYILKYDHTPLNSLYKIGITGKTAKERCAEIMRTLPNDNKRLEVVFERKFIAAYLLEQTLHGLLNSVNRPLPPTVSGHTEFFDLNFLTSWILMQLLSFLHFCQFMSIFGTVSWILFYSSAISSITKSIKAYFFVYISA